jgi:hypothetical protein
MHRGGRVSLAGMDWGGQRTTSSCSDSELFVTTLAADQYASSPSAAA